MTQLTVFDLKAINAKDAMSCFFLYCNEAFFVYFKIQLFVAKQTVKGTVHPKIKNAYFSFFQNHLDCFCELLVLERSAVISTDLLSFSPV